MQYGVSALITLILSLFGGDGRYQSYQHRRDQTPPPQSQQQPQEVPEPTTIFGSAIALSGFAYLKNKKKLNIAK